MGTGGWRVVFAFRSARAHKCMFVYSGGTISGRCRGTEGGDKCPFLEVRDSVLVRVSVPGTSRSHMNSTPVKWETPRRLHLRQPGGSVCFPFFPELLLPPSGVGRLFLGENNTLFKLLSFVLHLVISMQQLFRPG